MLSEIWPSDAEISASVASSISPQMFRERYADIMQEPRWDSIESSSSPLYPWKEDSTYVRLPSFLKELNQVLLQSNQ